MFQEEPTTLPQQNQSHPQEVTGMDLLSALPHLTWTCEPDGPCNYLGPQWVAYTGIPAEQHLGYGWLEALHPEDRQPTAEHWTATAAKGLPFHCEFRIRRHDGEYRWFQTSALPVQGDQGELLFWLGTNTDIQRIREAEERLRELNAELEQKVEERAQQLRETNEELSKTSAQLEKAQEITKTGSWSIEAESGKITWSSELFRIMGMEPATPVPNLDESRALMTETSFQRVEAAVTHSLETGEPYEIEIEVVRPNQERRICVGRAEASLDAEGHVLGLVGTFQDITELSQARSEVTRLSERLKMALDAGRIGVWDWDVTNDELTWDDTMYELYSVTKSEFEGAYHAWESRLHPEDKDAAEAELRRCLASGEHFEISFRLKPHQGEGTRFLRGVGQVYFDRCGKPARMVGLNYDVTVEKALTAQRLLLQQFVKYAPACIAMLDRELRYIQVSDRWMQDYQLGDLDLRGKCHYDVFPDIPDHWKESHQRVLAGAVERVDEDRFEREDGSVFWLEWECRPWLEVSGEIGGLIMFTHVITERKEMEQRLLEQQEALQRSNRDLEQFAYAASHDLQTPLRALIGCAQLLQEELGDSADEMIQEALAHISVGAQRMRDLIKAILEYSRVDTGSEVSFEDLDLELLLGEALALFQEEFSRPDIDMSVSVESGSVVPGLRHQLVLLFQNLIGNAIKYRKSEPLQVTLEVKKKQHQMEIAIADNGVGIEPEYHQRIFAMFQRLHTYHEIPGAGIGLALCRRVVERHRGSIQVESELGEGSTFIVRLPL